MTIELDEDENGVFLRVHAKPRSAKSRILGVREGVLDVAIAAPPVDGAANDELIRTIAAHFGIPKRRVMLMSGASSKHKRVHLAGVSASDILAKVR